MLAVGFGVQIGVKHRILAELERLSREDRKAYHELIDMYASAWGAPLPDVSWFRALAAYKFAIISGFNLGLHRRGKRHDPLWETTASQPCACIRPIIC